MSITLVAAIVLALAIVSLIAGSVVIVRDRGTTTVRRTGNSRSLERTPNGIKGEVFVGRKVGFQTKASISAVEVGRLRAQGEKGIPRAVAAVVFGFSLIMISIGTLILSVAGLRVGAVLLSAFFLVYGFMLPVGWFKKERASMIHAQTS